jgi:hypothetical protein
MKAIIFNTTGMIEPLELLGDIEIPDNEVEDDFAESLIGSYGAKDAIKIIRETNDSDILEAYKADETSDKKRSSVLKAIGSKLKDLAAKIEKQKEDK